MEINLKVSNQDYNELSFLAKESGHTIEEEILFQMSKGLEQERGDLLDHQEINRFVCRLLSADKLDA